MRVQLVAPHGWGNPAGRVNTPASPVLPLEGAGRNSGCVDEPGLFVVTRPCLRLRCQQTVGWLRAVKRDGSGAPDCAWWVGSGGAHAPSGGGAPPSRP